MTDEALVSIRRINPPELGVPPGYSQVVEALGGRIIFIAGQTALDRNGEVVGRANFCTAGSAGVPKFEYCPSVRRLYGSQFDQAHRLSAKHGQSVRLPRG